MSYALSNVAAADCTAAVQAWEQICEALSKHREIFLFVDFDGTLSPITSIPSAAAIDPAAKQILRRLCSEKMVTVCVLSGRSVSDVAERVGLPIIYGGDHGLEIHSSEVEFVVPGAESARLNLPAICNEIRQSVSHIPGALVEGKRYTASVHYRQVAPEHVAAVRQFIADSVDPFQFEVRSGKCVFEIRPRLKWNKGSAVRWILERHGATARQAICMGDDETDEDMFLEASEGVNVRVLQNGGVPRTAARCYVRQPEVPEFLRGILEVIQGIS